MNIVLFATSDKVSPFTEHVGVPLTVALLAFIATVGAAAISFVLSRLGEAKARRRDGYAAATQELIAWVEFPFRIKRRTTDDPATLTALAEVGHRHQEALRYRQTWIRTENRWVGNVYDDVRRDLASIIGPACNDAWGSTPIAKASDMTLGDWGPQGTKRHIARLERALAFRFGWRRVLGFTGWHPGA